MKRLINFILKPWRLYQERKDIKRKLAELREKDPFIYK